MHTQEILEDILGIFLFLIPVVVICIKLQVFRQFSYKKLIRSLNYTLLCAVIIYVAFILYFKIAPDNFIEKDGIPNIILREAYGYVILAPCIYIPLSTLLYVPYGILLLVRKIKKKPV